MPSDLVGFRQPDSFSETFPISSRILERRGTTDHSGKLCRFWKIKGSNGEEEYSPPTHEVLYTASGMSSHIEQSLELETVRKVLESSVDRIHFWEEEPGRSCLEPLGILENRVVP